ncbi:MAG: vanadium-dependent haloperoxidase [Chloroflexota bacterium]
MKLKNRSLFWLVLLLVTPVLVGTACGPASPPKSGGSEASRQPTAEADVPATRELVLEEEAESDELLLTVQEIDASQLEKLPTERALDLLTEIEIPIDERAHEETGLIYQVFDLPPGLRFVRGVIVGRPLILGTYTFTVLVDNVYLPNGSAIQPVIRQYEWTVKLPDFESPNPEHSIARQWNEVLLEAIRKDTARPTVHARNLFHVSSAMYDAWALYDETAVPYFHGDDIADTGCVPEPAEMSAAEIAAAQHETISYAAYRLLSWRFKDSPGHDLSQGRFDHLLSAVGYESAVVIADPCEGSPAAWGNFIAQSYIDYGLSDGANEAEDYASRFYAPVNPPFAVKQIVKELDEGHSETTLMNRWSPLAFDIYIGQANYVFVGGNPEFVSPEWGGVVPFALDRQDLTIHERDGNEYWVYHDPGGPPTFGGERQDEAMWGFLLVPQWASLLDPADGVRIDISPGAIGNNTEYENSFTFFQSFYSPDGGDNSPGHLVNPHTAESYEPNVVARADYGRVIAEFWADGPDSETPPGHWFTILNTVNDHPDLEKRYRGEGEVLDDLEWDIKSYFALGGAMHDAAVSAWGIKGWYDYARPVTAVRYMSFFGQRDPDLDWSQHPFSLPLIPGFIEEVKEDDVLFERALGDAQGEGPALPERKLKMYTWRGPDYIRNPDTDVAGVGWILAEAWWPYQRPTFVTPPFAGYVSGHSTFSRAAAEVLTLLTGDPFFPGGLGEHLAPQNEFLVFEEGPSEDVVLQWATYRDAADQSAISRIWGGIHPPADDMPGRLIGADVGQDAFAHADSYFSVIGSE